MRVLLMVTIILGSFAIDVAGQSPCKEARTVSVNARGDTIITVAEVPPHLKEGFEQYMRWIKNNINKKLLTKKTEEKKKVYVSFVVHEDGTTSGFRIERGSGNPYDKEALRLIMENPQSWVAGQWGNKKVKMRMVLPVQF